MGDVLKLAVVRAEHITESVKQAGRKRLGIWLRHVEAKTELRELIDFDGRVARAMTKFPSAVIEGHCWVGQLRLSGSLARSDRTLRRSIARLERCGLLLVRQRGARRSASYIFCINGKPVSPNLEKVAAFCASRTRRRKATAPASARTEMSGLARTHVSGLKPSARTLMSGESTKELIRRDSTNHRESTFLRTLPVGEIIDRVIRRLGRGDEEFGFSIYRKLTDEVKGDLRHRERENQFTEEMVESVLRGTRNE